MKFGATLRQIVAVKDPGQHAVHRLGCLVADRPVAVPALEALTGRVALQVEDRIDEQLLLRTAVTKQRPFLQVTLQPRRHPPQNHLRQGEGLGIGAIDRHQADVGGDLGRL